MPDKRMLEVSVTFTYQAEVSDLYPEDASDEEILEVERGNFLAEPDQITSVATDVVVDARVWTAS